LPHGSYSLLVVVLSSVGWLGTLFQNACDYAVVSGPIVQQLHPTYTAGNDVPYLEFGMAAYRLPTTGSVVGNNHTDTSFTGTCSEYPPDELLDGRWRAARVCSFLALVLGGGGTIFVWCSTCFVFSRVTWKWTGYELLLASVCQALAYVWFTTQMCSWNTCSLSLGSQSDFIAVACWFLAGLLIVCKYPVPYSTVSTIETDEEDEVDPQEEEEYGRTIEATTIPTKGHRMTAAGELSAEEEERDEDLPYPNAEIA
jgi:hypothetical protein